MAVDQGKLNEFLGRFVGDLGATVAAGNIVVGHRLGLYQALAAGPATPEELAARTQTDPRYITEWLRGQAAGGYVTYQPDSGSYELSEEQAFALADPTGAVYAPGAFVLALSALRAESQITESFRTWAGMGWHEHHDDVFLGCEPFAGDAITDNLSPVGRTYYSFSSFLCVPNARSQPGGYALGAQAGEAAIRQVALDAGFTRFRRAAETPFNIVLEARP